MSLPNVFQNKAIQIESNHQDLYYGKSSMQREKKTIKKIDVSKKIKDLFSSTNYVYKLNVHIVTVTNEIDTVIIGQTNNNLITYDNNLIPIHDIVDISENY